MENMDKKSFALNPDSFAFKAVDTTYRTTENYLVPFFGTLFSFVLGVMLFEAFEDIIRFGVGFDSFDSYEPEIGPVSLLAGVPAVCVALLYQLYMRDKYGSLIGGHN